MPRVSVIIPSYNHEKYVAEAIQSVLDQTYQDFEIIITDDGSRDGTVEVIQQFSDPRIKLFVFEENQGASIAANHCIENATGEFISLLNSDDVYYPEKLDKQVSFLDKHTEFGAVFSYPEFIDEDSKLITKEHFYQAVFNQPNRSRFEWLNYFFYNGNCLCNPSILIRKKCYETVGLYDPRLAQLPDFDFWIRLCQKYEIFILDESLIKFRIRENEANVSGRRTESYIRLSSELVQIYKNYLDLEVLHHTTQIFPEIHQFTDFKNIKNFDIEIYQYFIAKLALNTQFNSAHYFAIDLLFKLLNRSNNNSSRIQKFFTYKNLIELTQTVDPFREKLKLELSEELLIFKNSRFFQLQEAWLKLKSWFGFNPKQRLF